MNRLHKSRIQLLIAGASIVFMLVKPNQAVAQDITCTVVYGQGEVCGVATTEEPVVEHEPVVAGVGDLNFMVIAQIVGLAGATLFLLSQFSKRIYILDR